MVFRGGRRGRPGLLGTVARTAVVAGTAKATSNAMDRRSQRKASEQQQEYQQEYQQQQPPPQQQVAPCSPFPLQARTIWSPSCRSWDSFISPAC